MRIKKMTAIIFGAMLILAPRMHPQFSDPASGPLSAMTVPQARLMQAAELVRLLKTNGVDRPLMLQVGSHVMFAQAHIPGLGVCGARIADGRAAIVGEGGCIDARRTR